MGRRNQLSCVFPPGHAGRGYHHNRRDVTERKRAQHEREKLRQLELDFAHMNRLSMMGELATSLSHEITQPIASARNNARAAPNILKMQPPDLGEVMEALACAAGDTDRGTSSIAYVRTSRKHRRERSVLILMWRSTRWLHWREAQSISMASQSKLGFRKDWFKSGGIGFNCNKS